ncbi:MAG TPA: glycoside hydrolase family 43 protein [Thermoanaerobaculia bacterium]|nr:glycoside hydrolase family 43 protein [Thermoanaerobaculia bacterium]
MTYVNPVWPHSFPDPFVLKFRGEYWGYCTGFWTDGRCFGVIRSRDLVHWEVPEGGAGAMAPLPGGHTCYWAPEVTYENGRFYLYYSVGNEERMEIRVAVSDNPAGPFVDSGRRLTSEPFAIDAHVFVDDDGSRHLFYATDFLDHSHIGTGTVRDLMRDPFTLAGEPVPVTRPRHDWHVYHPNRPEKGYVRWHTVEGPFVLKRNGLYYQMFSGGNWQNPTYGVSYAVTDSLDSPGEWEQQERPILRTIEGKVIGPGHNSVVRGPDNRQLVCVYHRWVSGARVLAIDPMGWEGERLVVDGPSTEPRALSQPVFADFFDKPGGLDLRWDVRGDWFTGGGSARQPRSDASCEARLDIGTSSFVVEVSARALEEPQGDTGFGIGLRGFVFLIGRELPLPPGFEPRAWHLIRVEVDGTRVEVSVDGIRWKGSLPEAGRSVSLLTYGVAAEFSGFAIS